MHSKYNYFGLAIGQHLLDNKICPKNSILINFNFIYNAIILSTVEAICTESLKLSPRRQKDFFLG